MAFLLDQIGWHRIAYWEGYWRLYARAHQHACTYILQSGAWVQVISILLVDLSVSFLNGNAVSFLIINSSYYLVSRVAGVV